MDQKKKKLLLIIIIINNNEMKMIIWEQHWSTIRLDHAYYMSYTNNYSLLYDHSTPSNKIIRTSVLCPC